MTPTAHTLHPLDGTAALAEAEALSELLVDCVEGGASLGFMAPLTRDRALAFWRKVAAGVTQGERLLLVARNPQGGIDGTVQLVLAQPENQPHRADLSKLLVHRRGRRHGLGEALMKAAEHAAREHGKRLLVLDTATPEADRLYRRLGWQHCGAIPGYALMPDGALCATDIFYKQVA
jgi:GNAT superfamily N-acetyltransferase